MGALKAEAVKHKTYLMTRSTPACGQHLRHFVQHRHLRGFVSGASLVHHQEISVLGNKLIGHSDLCREHFVFKRFVVECLKALCGSDAG